MRPAQKIVAAALGVGIAVGGMTAVALPDDRTAPARTPRTAPPVAGGSSAPRGGPAEASRGAVPSPLKPVVPPAPPQPASRLSPVRGTVVRRVAAARPEPTTPGAVHLRVQGRMRVVATVPDPGGGPRWAVRVFDAQRTHDADGPTKVIGRNRCAQLGRVHRGRFGWLDGSGTFRPTRPSLHTSLTECGSRRADLRRRPETEVVRTTTGLRGTRPRLAATVLWGRLGRGAQDVDVRFGARRDSRTQGRDRVVLRVGSPDLDPRTVSVTTRYAPKGRLIEAADPGGPAALLAVRVADPSGGPAYGLAAARRGDGSWCVGPVGRVVDGRSGTMNFRLGTFTEHSGRRFACQGRPGDRRPVPVQSSGGEDLGDDPSYSEAAPRPGRVARRVAAGVTWTAGQARADVRSLTFRTPRDVRTLVPSGPARAFLVVYDGQFPAGRSELVATLESGRQEREPLFLSVY